MLERDPSAPRPSCASCCRRTASTVTQATLSRDLEELGAVRCATPTARSATPLPARAADTRPQRRPTRRRPRPAGPAAARSCWSAPSHSANLVVLRTPPGGGAVPRQRHRPLRAARRHSAPSRATTRCCSCAPEADRRAGGGRRRRAAAPAAEQQPRRPRGATHVMTGATHRLWGGRFAGGPSAALAALQPLDALRLAARALRPRRVAGARPGAAPRRPARRRRAGAMLGALDALSSRGRRGHLRAGRGDEDVHDGARARPDRAARRARRQAARRPQPQRPGRHRLPALPARRRAGARRASSPPCRTRCSARPSRYRRRALAGLHPPAARPAGARSAHELAHVHALARDVDRLRDWDRRAPPVAPRLRRAGRFVAARRPRGGRRRARLHRRVANSIDAVSDRDFVAEFLLRRRAARRAPSPARRGGLPLDVDGVRLGDARRRLVDRVVDHAAEEEPRRRRARPRQVGPAHRPPHRRPRDAQGPAVRLQPRPAGGQGAGRSTRSTSCSWCCRP